jgi:Flp pilus assembly protein TadG
MDGSIPQSGVPRTRGLFSRLRRSTDGAAAVEFALVSIPFFALLFAILETALAFFVGQLLDSATAQVGRLVRTGQAHQTGLTAEQMAEQICAGMIGISDCESRLAVDVRSYNSFGVIDLASPMNADGDFEGLQYNIGASSQIVVVRAYFTWPIFFKLLTPSSATPKGDRLLASVSAFRNEPFPW